MEIILPKFGLFFWTIVIFLIYFLILKSFAWGPIIGAIKAREASIEESLKAASKAKSDMEQLTATNAALLKEAALERDKMLKEAQETKSRIVEEAKTIASAEAKKIVEAAKETIEVEKAAAKAEIRSLAGSISVEIAELILRKKLENTNEQQALVKSLVDNIKLN